MWRKHVGKSAQPTSPARGGGKARVKKLEPDPNAQGPHTSYKVDPKTGKVTKYETYTPQTNPKDPKPWKSRKRYDGKGKSHYNKKTDERVHTPHVQGPNIPGGVRQAYNWEIPL